MVVCSFQSLFFSFCLVDLAEIKVKKKTLQNFNCMSAAEKLATINLFWTFSELKTKIKLEQNLGQCRETLKNLWLRHKNLDYKDFRKKLHFLTVKFAAKRNFHRKKLFLQTFRLDTKKVDRHWLKTMKVSVKNSKEKLFGAIIKFKFNRKHSLHVDKLQKQCLMFSRLFTLCFQSCSVYVRQLIKRLSSPSSIETRFK
jgi:hypothetical protein